MVLSLRHCAHGSRSLDGRVSFERQTSGEIGGATCAPGRSGEGSIVGIYDMQDIFQNTV
jgi:hypothetical protein